MENSELLKEISFFSNMSTSELKEISAITTLKEYAKGAIIIEEMTEAERFFIIYRGKIEISKRFEGDDSFVLSVQSDGDFFGEMALLDEGRRSASVRALEQTTVLEIHRKDFDSLLYKAPILAYRILKELSSRLRETGALLISHLQQSNRKIYRAYIDTMTMVLGVVDPPDARAGSRITRVKDVSLAIGTKLGLSEEEMLNLELGALFHDLGMLAVSDSILGKSGALSESERVEIRRHIEEGSRLVKAIPFLATSVPEAMLHHERFDGSGYPVGIKGSNIPLASRIIALADAVAAMARDRPHMKRFPMDKILAEIREASGKQFDPRVADAFLSLYESGDPSIVSILKSPQP